MKLLYLILFASFGARAANSYVVGEDLLLAMDAYSRAANLQPQRAQGDDELRIWTRDYMAGRIEGVVIAKSGAIRCRAASHYMDGVVVMDRARCRPWHKGKDAIDALDPLSALGNKEWDCPVFDGGEVFIDAVRNGKRFALRVGNPWACDDADSKAVMDLLDKLW